jgi:hypothetical protein
MRFDPVGAVEFINYQNSAFVGLLCMEDENAQYKVKIKLK